ncbi:MAG: glutamate--tRNA ligase [Candidatus Pacebacteria bacterium]|nr:glutamate--tRNA ligase [Candidatus Paceibacterota bacterium]
MKKIRTRFAPSPTGYLHVGSLRTALYCYLFAKHNEGDFVLRIEDTDRARYVEGSIENLVKILDFMGLEYNEGVSADNDGKIVQKGNFGPYMQSERLEIYKKYVDELIENGFAYYCFCSKGRLDEMRKNQQLQKQAPMYDGKCQNLSKEEIQKLLDKKTPYVVRLKVPKEGFVEFKDLVYGKIRIENKTIDDQVIMKSDGFPTYHLANVVDDHLMEISHVIRGEEWLPSTPKHILLYKAFGWEAPEFAHLPLLLNSDKSKLSKRQGDVAVEDFLKLGYLPEALLNFVLLLGWNPKTEEEIFSLDEMIKRFDLSGVNKAGSIFNTEKLDWINGMYIRKMDLDELTKLCVPFLIEAKLIEQIDEKYKIKNSGEIIDFEYIKKVIALERERMKKISEIGESVKFIFSDELDYEKELLIWKKMTVEDVKNNLQLVFEELKNLDENNFQSDKLLEILNNLVEKNELKRGEVFWPLRVALTGLKGSPGPFEIAEVLGKAKVLKRIEFAIEKL